MNKKSSEPEQKPKTSKLAIASIICLGLSFVFCFSMGSVVVFFYIPIVGIVALMHIGLSKGRLRGKGLAIMSIVIPICLLLTFISMRNLKWYIQRSFCASNHSKISAALKLYANDYEDQLPTPESWCDLLITQVQVDYKTFYTRESDAFGGESIYALNKNVVGMKLSEIPGNVVLIFETDFGRNTGLEKLSSRDYYWKVNDPNDNYYVHRGNDMEVDKDRWNQVGGKEILTTEYHGDNGCHILFADGTAKFIKKKDLETLRWEP